MKRSQQSFVLAALSGLCLALSSCASPTRAADTVVPVPAIPSVAASTAYSVKVNGEEVAVNDESRFDFQTAMFTMSGTANVEIKVLTGNAQKCTVHPLRHKITPQVAGDTLSFTISKPLKLVVKVEGAPNLALIATPLETDVPKEGDKNVIYFGPGVHEGGAIKPQDGQTIYLAPGALVMGRIEATGVKDVTVKGRGILDTSKNSSRAAKRCGVLFNKCSNVKVEGIGVRGGSWWQTLYLASDNVEVSQMNLFGKEINTDGVDIDGVKNFAVRDTFIRSGDDGLGWHAVDAKANGENPTDGALAEDCVIWDTTGGNGIRIGASMETALFQNVTFRNIDILWHNMDAIRSDHSDWALCKNIRFENIYDEAPRNQAINFFIAKTSYSNDNGYKDERGHFDGLHFINVNSAAKGVTLLGLDKDHLIENVTFQNCRVGDKTLSQPSDIKTNEFVKNVSFENK
jgi:polygalacturonase